MISYRFYSKYAKLMLVYADAIYRYIYPRLSAEIHTEYALW